MQLKATTEIRSVGLSKINRIVRAAGRLKELKPAFAEWQDGEIYVCKKSGDYRYRFGDRSKSVTPWSAIALELFKTPAEFAFAAMVLAPPPVPKPKPEPQAPVEQPAKSWPPVRRLNIIRVARGGRGE